MPLASIIFSVKTQSLLISSSLFILLLSAGCSHSSHLGTYDNDAGLETLTLKADNTYSTNPINPQESSTTLESGTYKIDGDSVTFTLEGQNYPATFESNKIRFDAISYKFGRYYTKEKD